MEVIERATKWLRLLFRESGDAGWMVWFKGYNAATGMMRAEGWDGGAVEGRSFDIGSGLSSNIVEGV